MSRIRMRRVRNAVRATNERILYAVTAEVEERASNAKNVGEVRTKLLALCNHEEFWQAAKEIEEVTKKFSRLMDRY